MTSSRMSRSPAVAAAVRTAVQTTVAGLLLIVVGLLVDVQVWVTGGPSPDLAQLRVAVVLAVLAPATALVTAVHRRMRPPAADYPATSGARS